MDRYAFRSSVRCEVTNEQEVARETASVEPIRSATESKRKIRRDTITTATAHTACRIVHTTQTNTVQRGG